MRRSEQVNYYQILGVDPNAPVAMIREAYRNRISQYHPDRNPSVHANAIAALLNEAWGVLGDSERRRAYDEVTQNPAAAAAPQAHTQQKSNTHAAPQSARPKSKDGNRRASDRLKTLFTVWVTMPPKAFYATATCLDLATSGMALTLGAYVRAGTSLTLTLDLPGGALETAARVVRCDPLKRHGRWKVAVAFTSQDAHTQAEIAGFIERERHMRLD